ncbi:MAG TPA: 50S ribosomal protein L23, partial [Candidatus Woesearchaeota archaeon]|nr:50S ribosomal protein L23 [Candidatus Woesearchaeota archaeon]
MDPTKIIKGVVSTEKAIKLREEQNVITLVVDRKANKQMVSEAMLKMFGVKAIDVKVINTVKGYK